MAFKRLLSGLLFVAVLELSGLSAAENQEKYFILDNGLKVFLLERHNLPLVNIVAAVNAGSKDETAATNGIAHLLEHYILFRGTEARSGSEVAKEVRRHGAYFNAHTGQDLALFEISLPSEFAEFGLRNQKEILFDLKFDPEEVEAEKDVILEEISQLKDDPFRYASVRLYGSLFAGHPYGRPVIGTPETIRALTVDQIDKFYKTLFVPGNSALSVIGDFTVQDMEDKIRAVFGSLPKAEFAPAEFAPPAELAKAVDIQEELDVQEAYLIIGTAGPGYNNPDQYSSDILASILGRGITPLLYRPLKSARDLINTAGMSFLTLKYGGAFCVYLTLDPKRIAAAKNQAVQFLKQVRNENFSKSDVFGEASQSAYDYLEGAKNQILFDVQQAQENGLTLATSMAMHLLLRDKDETLDYLGNIRKVTSSDLRRTAAKYLGKSDYVVVAIVPRKK